MMAQKKPVAKKRIVTLYDLEVVLLHTPSVVWRRLRALSNPPWANSLRTGAR